MDDKEKYEVDELTAMAMLADVMNDAPTDIVIANKVYHIRGLRWGTQNLIAAESCKIQKAQEGNIYDLYKQFAQSADSVVKCIAFAILNDKDKIFKNYVDKEYSDEFYDLCAKIEWESNRNTWMQVLVEVMNKIDLRFFYQAASTLMMIRDSALKTRKNQEHT